MFPRLNSGRARFSQTGRAFQRGSGKRTRQSAPKLAFQTRNLVHPGVGTLTDLLKRTARGVATDNTTWAERPERSLRLRYGIAAGLFGRAATTLATVFLLPFCLKFLGIEAVGLIGFYATVGGIMQIVDQVCGVVVTRETSRFSRALEGSDRVRDVLVTAVALYVLGGLVVAATIAGGAPIIARHWLSSATLSEQTVIVCLVITGCTIPFQLLVNLHVSALIGLERQIEANIILAFAGIGRAVLAVLAVLQFGTVVGYFGAQLAALMISLALSIALTWRRMPAGTRQAAVRFGIVADTWRFGALLMANAFAFTIVTQSDKMIVSGLLPLSTFGYYALAATPISVLSFIISSVSMVVLPRFTHLFERRATSEVAALYRLASQFVSIALLSAWAVAFFFPDWLMMAWTGDPAAATELRLVLPLLFSGATLLSLACVPNALALAAGWPELPLYSNLASLGGVPIGYVLTVKYGMLGATEVWLLFGLLNVTITPILLQRRALKGLGSRWYLVDIGVPALATSAVALLARLLISHAFVADRDVLNSVRSPLSRPERRQ